MADQDFDDDTDQTSVFSQDDLNRLLEEDQKRSAHFITIMGRNVGQMYKLSHDKTFIGRLPTCEIRLHDEGVSRQHAQIEFGFDGFVLSDIGSTNGVFVNGEKIDRHVMQDGDRVQFGSNTILRFSYTDVVDETFQKKLYESATKDSLTGAYNKKYFFDQIKIEFAYARRHGTPLSLVLIDIDFFKKVNDSYGHVAGDFVLKVVAQLVRDELRVEDFFARYGGEEFGILLRDTDSDRAFFVAERIRQSISGHEFVFDGQKFRITISAGIATVERENYEKASQLVKTADRYLYEAKNDGRNRVAPMWMG